MSRRNLVGFKFEVVARSGYSKYPLEITSRHDGLRVTARSCLSSSSKSPFDESPLVLNSGSKGRGARSEWRFEGGRSKARRGANYVISAGSLFVVL